LGKVSRVRNVKEHEVETGLGFGAEKTSLKDKVLG
jgi:hypothetical protein